MLEFIKHLYYNTAIGHLLIHPAKILYDYYYFRLIPDKIFIKRKFKYHFGYDLNLDNPRTLNEKIQWLKRNDRTHLHTLCADKFAVREYVKEKIGEEYLIPLLYHTRNPVDITPGNLPDTPFIIKTNHDCRGHIIVRNKADIDWKSTQADLKKKLKRNYYYLSKEWQYKNIEPRILVEKLLTDENRDIPSTYMFHCFHGKLAIVQDLREEDGQKITSTYDDDWNVVDCEWGFKNGSFVDMPQGFYKMRSLAEALAENYYYVRVDLYNIDSEIYFGELDLTPFAGFMPFVKPEWDLKLGDRLILPIEKV